MEQQPRLQTSRALESSSNIVVLAHAHYNDLQGLENSWCPVQIGNCQTCGVTSTAPPDVRSANVDDQESALRQQRVWAYLNSQ